MRPETIPVLKGKDAERFEKKAVEPPSEATIKTFQKAQKVYVDIKRL
jgi:hypothetical protein